MCLYLSISSLSSGRSILVDRRYRGFNENDSPTSDRVRTVDDADLFRVLGKKDQRHGEVYSKEAVRETHQALSDISADGPSRQALVQEDSREAALLRSVGNPAERRIDNR